MTLSEILNKLKLLITDMEEQTDQTEQEQTEQEQTEQEQTDQKQTEQTDQKQTEQTDQKQTEQTDQKQTEQPEPFDYKGAYESLLTKYTLEQNKTKLVQELTGKGCKAHVLEDACKLLGDIEKNEAGEFIDIVKHVDALYTRVPEFFNDSKKIEARAVSPQVEEVSPTIEQLYADAVAGKGGN